jgi:hypothetical protein
MTASPRNAYLGWLGQRFAAARRVLTPTGALFVAIGRKYQAEVYVMLKRIDFHLRDTIVWAYAFGPAQRRRFTPALSAERGDRFPSGAFEPLSQRGPWVGFTFLGAASPLESLVRRPTHPPPIFYPRFSVSGGLYARQEAPTRHG